MSGRGAPEPLQLDASQLRVAVVAATWHSTVMDGLLSGAQRALVEAGVADCAVVRVPGSFELPFAAQRLARQGYDAIVALGVVIRGGTPHFEYVCTAATNGLARVSVERDVPVGFGLLTCDSEAQALDRAGLPGSREDKGYECAQAALASALAVGLRAHDFPTGAPAMKSFEQLYAELRHKASTRPDGSGTVSRLDGGVHEIGKKLVEEAAEAWMAAEHEGRERAAQEIGQLLYHTQVLMLACDLALDDVYEHL